VVVLLKFGDAGGQADDVLGVMPQFVGEFHMRRSNALMRTSALGRAFAASVCLARHVGAFVFSRDAPIS
jgi:hypothetical protein